MSPNSTLRLLPNLAEQLYAVKMLDSEVTDISRWLNSNQGLVSVLLFLATILFGWLSGIFSSLRRKPKIQISAVDGPTFACTYGTGAEYEGYDIHRTGIAIYLRLANVGSAPTSIENISIGYRWAINPGSKLWWKYGLFRFWLENQTMALDDFQAAIGENSMKFYPFLTQTSSQSGKDADTFLEVGKSINGVAYFEQDDSFGACFPQSSNWIVNLKVAITDVYGKKHSAKISVPKVSLAKAREFNPSFGKTLVSMRSDQEVFDLPADENGNLIPSADNQ